MKKITMKQRFGVASAIGVAGGAVAFAITVAGDGLFSDWGFVRVAIAGAFLAGLLVAPGLGGSGARGWFLSGLSFAAATILGAIFAVLLLPLEEFLSQLDFLRDVQEIAAASLLGPIYVIGTAGESALVLAGWITAHGAAQALSMALRRAGH